MTRFFYQSLTVLALALYLFGGQASGAATLQIQAPQANITNAAPARAVSRARTELEVRRLRLLVSARKIDADQLIKAMSELSGLTSEK